MLTDDPRAALDRCPDLHLCVPAWHAPRPAHDVPMTDLVPLPSPAPVPCPHCEDGHGKATRTAWNVTVGPERDGDGQPIRLWVQPTAGAHVAWEDALWLWRLIRERDRLVADRPLDLGPDGLPRLRR